MKRIKIKTYDKIYFFKSEHKKRFYNALEEIERNPKDLFFISIVCSDTAMLQDLALAMQCNTHIIKTSVFINKTDYYDKKEQYNRSFFSLDERLDNNLFGR